MSDQKLLKQIQFNVQSANGVKKALIKNAKRQLLKADVIQEKSQQLQFDLAEADLELPPKALSPKAG